MMKDLESLFAKISLGKDEDEKLSPTSSRGTEKWKKEPSRKPHGAVRSHHRPHHNGSLTAQKGRSSAKQSRGQEEKKKTNPKIEKHSLEIVPDFFGTVGQYHALMGGIVKAEKIAELANATVMQNVDLLFEKRCSSSSGSFWIASTETDAHEDMSPYSRWIIKVDPEEKGVRQRHEDELRVTGEVKAIICKVKKASGSSRVNVTAIINGGELACGYSMGGVRWKGVTMKRATNMLQFERMSWALEQLVGKKKQDCEKPGRKSLIFDDQVRSILLGHILPTAACGIDTAASEGIVSWVPDDGHLIGKLNTGQQLAVRSVLERQNLTLVQGPPGTGKTSMAASLILTALKYHREKESNDNMRFRILVCGPSNIAVDNLALRLMAAEESAGLSLTRVYSRTKEMEETILHETCIGLHQKIEKLIDEDPLLGEIGETYRSLKRKMNRLGESLSPEDFELLERYEHYLSERVLRNSDCVFATCAMAGDKRITEANLNFGMLIIDEACQAIEPLSLIAIAAAATSETSRPEPVRVCMIGDHKQLGPVVKGCKSDLPANAERSLFERLMAVGWVPELLNKQYRMHPSLSIFSNRQFYFGELSDGIGTVDRVINYANNAQHRIPWPSKAHPMLFWDTKGREIQGDSSTSFANRAEVFRVCDVVKFLHRQCAIKLGRIGVLTFYADQRDALQRALAHHGLWKEPRVKRVEHSFDEVELATESDDDNVFGKPSNPSLFLSSKSTSSSSSEEADEDDNRLEVANVDAFQGSEKDFMILSCVRSGTSRIGFLRDRRRLNVALTRAKYGLIVIGNLETLETEESIWKSLMRHFRYNNCIMRSKFFGSTST